MQLCDYGCGQEAKYPFKNGKWCCSKSHRQCPVHKKKNSIRMKKLHKDPNSKINSILSKEKKSNSMKDIHKDPNSKYNSIEYKKKIGNNTKKIWDDPNSVFNTQSYREKKSNATKKIWDDPNSKLNSILCKEKMIDGVKKAHKDPNSKYNSIEYKRRSTLNIERINIKYSFFSKIEEMRYNPDKPNEEEIQVRCKNHECKNSKEKNGWFTPTYTQLYERIRNLEKDYGSGGAYFYCSQYCKDTCILFNLQSDPYKDNNLPYNQQEYQTCRAVVFERENGLCEYCGEPATDMHHIFPVKLEPFFALDPDYCIACCEKHHYKYAHQGECSTGNLAKIVCGVESQKFLNKKGD